MDSTAKKIGRFAAAHMQKMKSINKMTSDSSGKGL